MRDIQSIFQNEVVKKGDTFKKYCDIALLLNYCICTVHVPRFGPFSFLYPVSPTSQIRKGGKTKVSCINSCWQPVTHEKGVLSASFIPFFNAFFPFFLSSEEGQ